jgi:methyl-accepting chemotaxis protein
MSFFEKIMKFIQNALGFEEQDVKGEFVYFWDDVDKDYQIEQDGDDASLLKSRLKSNQIGISFILIFVFSVGGIISQFVDLIVLTLLFVTLLLLSIILAYYLTIGVYQKQLEVVENQAIKLNQLNFRMDDINIIENQESNTIQNIESFRIKLVDIFNTQMDLIREINYQVAIMDNSFMKTSDNIENANQLFDESLIRTSIFQELKGYISLSSAAIDDFTNTFDDTIGIINQVIKLLKSIGRQTTMLAMNAGIEAAKSEEQSAGFEIVAANLQRLSQHTVQSSENLKKQITQIEDNARLSVEQITTAMDNLSEQLSNTHENLNQVQNELNQISGNVDTVSESHAKIGNSVKVIEEQIEKIEF